MHIYTGAKTHVQYELNQKISEGGEGTIYTIKQHSSLVAKLIKPTHMSDSKRTKISAITQLPPIKNTAWPAEALIDTNNHIVGFVMPYLENTRPLNYFFDKVVPDYAVLYRIALNLSLCVETIHTQGHVIGDINPQNLVVHPDLTVWAVDCDSMQITKQNDIYRCLLSRIEYTPPEFTNCNVHTTIRTPNHDAFGLAVLIFQLLMGTSPFHAVSKNSSNTMERIDVECMRNYIFPYINNENYQPLDHALPFDALPIVLKNLFIQAFTTTKRPSATTWKNTIYMVIKSLSRCDKGHAFPSGAQCLTCLAQDIFLAPINLDPKRLVALIIDTAHSVQDHTRITVRDYIQSFLHDTQQDPTLHTRIELALITLQHLDTFRTLNSMSIPTFTTNNPYTLGTAIEHAFTLIHTRVQLFRSFGIPYYAPIIVIISAGYSTDNMDIARSLISHHEKTKTIATYIRTLPHANLENLSTLNNSWRITDLHAHPLKNLINFSGYGSWGEGSFYDNYRDESSDNGWNT